MLTDSANQGDVQGASAESNAAASGQPSTSAAQAPSVDPKEYEAIKSELAVLREHKEKLEQERYQQREAERQRKAESQKLLEEQGSYKALAESLKEQAAALASEKEALAQQYAEAAKKASAYDAAQAKLQEIVKAEIAKLDEGDRVFVQAIPNLDLQRAAIERFLGQKIVDATPSPTKSATPGGAPTTKSGKPDFATLQRGDTAALQQAIREHPQDWAAFVHQSNAPRRQTLFERARAMGAKS